jgi:hypothetical protein
MPDLRAGVEPVGGLGVSVLDRGSRSEKISDGDVRSGEEHAVLGEVRSVLRMEVAGGRLTFCFLNRLLDGL